MAAVSQGNKKGKRFWLVQTRALCHLRSFNSLDAVNVLTKLLLSFRK